MVLVVPADVPRASVALVNNTVGDAGRIELKAGTIDRGGTIASKRGLPNGLANPVE